MKYSKVKSCLKCAIRCSQLLCIFVFRTDEYCIIVIWRLSLFNPRNTNTVVVIWCIYLCMYVYIYIYMKSERLSIRRETQCNVKSGVFLLFDEYNNNYLYIYIYINIPYYHYSVSVSWVEQTQSADDIYIYTPQVSRAGDGISLQTYGKKMWIYLKCQIFEYLNILKNTSLKMEPNTTFSGRFSHRALIFPCSFFWIFPWIK